MSSTGVRVRPAHRADAAALADMANALNEHVGIRHRPFTPERILADGFGPQPAFAALVAELDGQVVGYAMWSWLYNTDIASRSAWLHDLFVMESARARGVGTALMAAVAAETVAAGGTVLEWGVHDANAGAVEFYRRLGATGGDVRIMALAGQRLRELAAERARLAH